MADRVDAGRVGDGVVCAFVHEDVEFHETAQLIVGGLAETDNVVVALVHGCLVPDVGICFVKGV